MNNKDLLYSTVYIDILNIFIMGKNLKKNIYMYIYIKLNHFI